MQEYRFIQNPLSNPLPSHQTLREAFRHKGTSRQIKIMPYPGSREPMDYGPPRGGQGHQAATKACRYILPRRDNFVSRSSREGNLAGQASLSCLSLSTALAAKVCWRGAHMQPQRAQYQDTDRHRLLHCKGILVLCSCGMHTPSSEMSRSLLG